MSNNKFVIYDGKGIEFTVEKEAIGGLKDKNAIDDNIYSLCLKVATPDDKFSASHIQLTSILHSKESEFDLDIMGLFGATKDQIGKLKANAAKEEPKKFEKPDIEIIAEVFPKEDQDEKFYKHYEKAGRTKHGWEGRALLIHSKANLLDSEDFSKSLRENGVLGVFDKKTENKLLTICKKFHEITMNSNKELDTLLGEDRQDSKSNVTADDLHSALSKLESLIVKNSFPKLPDINTNKSNFHDRK